MIIYPSIEIHKGKSVNLKHGSFDEPTMFDMTPLATAKAFEDGGAQWLHVVDLDAVFEQESNNTDAIKAIIDQSQIPVQVGGGIRSEGDVDSWIDAGAERVVLGTIAVIDQRLVENVCVKYPEKIVVSIDARGGKVVSHGWKSTSVLTALDMAKRYEKTGVAAIIYTDIDRSNEHPESSMANTTQMGTELDCPVISSGTIRDLDDISFLANLPNIAGAVTGWALSNKRFTIQEAVETANQAPTKAKFI